MWRKNLQPRGSITLNRPRRYRLTLLLWTWKSKIIEDIQPRALNRRPRKPTWRKRTTLVLPAKESTTRRMPWRGTIDKSTWSRTTWTLTHIHHSLERNVSMSSIWKKRIKPKGLSEPTWSTKSDWRYARTAKVHPSNQLTSVRLHQGHTKKNRKRRRGLPRIGRSRKPLWKFQDRPMPSPGPPRLLDPEVPN